MYGWACVGGRGGGARPVLALWYYFWTLCYSRRALSLLLCASCTFLLVSTDVLQPRVLLNNFTGPYAGAGRQGVTVTNKSIALLYTVYTNRYPDVTRDNAAEKLAFVTTLIPAFCGHTSPLNRYTFHIAYFMSDPILATFLGENNLRKTIEERLMVGCGGGWFAGQLAGRVHVQFTLAEDPNAPARALATIALSAYFNASDYYYVISDRTQFTDGWLERHVAALAGLSPPYVGVVMGEDGEHFLHDSHMNTFGNLYPREAQGRGEAAAWLTAVYPPQRRPLLHGLGLTPALQARLEEDRELHQRYAQAAAQGLPVGDGSLIVSLSLYGADPRYTRGVVRNAQLLPVNFPGWRMRIYLPKPGSGSIRSLPVPEAVVRKLHALGVQMVFVGGEVARDVPPMMWRFLAADDPGVTAFVVRDCDSRLTVRDAAVVAEWLRTNEAVHCVRDHPSHGDYSLSGGLWGARTQPLRELLGGKLQTMMRGYRAAYLQDMHFLSREVYPRVRLRMLCHDSVSCERWGAGAVPFPVRRHRTEHLGQVYDQWDIGRQVDIDIIKRTPRNEKCEPMAPTT